MDAGCEVAPTLLLAGATGFIGTGIARALASAGTPSRWMMRAPLPGQLALPGQVLVSGDLTKPATLAAALADVTTVIHAASYVGDDPVEQRRVNVEGTRNLVAAAASQGARITYVSTFGVLGGAYSPGATEDEVTPRPRSSLSASRYEAEHIVLEHGGTVVRPALVFGNGDRWVVPTLVAVTRWLGAWVEDGRPLTSLIDRDTLGELIVAVNDHRPAGEIFHAAARTPYSIRQIVEPALVGLGLPVPTRTIGRIEAAKRLASRGFDSSKVDMLARDSWLDTKKIWKLTPSWVLERSPFSQAELDHYGSVLGSRTHAKKSPCQD